MFLISSLSCIVGFIRELLVLYGPPWTRVLVLYLLLLMLVTWISAGAFGIQSTLAVVPASIELQNTPNMAIIERLQSKWVTAINAFVIPYGGYALMFISLANHPFDPTNGYSIVDLKQIAATNIGMVVGILVESSLFCGYAMYYCVRTLRELQHYHQQQRDLQVQTFHASQSQPQPKDQSALPTSDVQNKERTMMSTTASLFRKRLAPAPSTNISLEKRLGTIVFVATSYIGFTSFSMLSSSYYFIVYYCFEFTPYTAWVLWLGLDIATPLIFLVALVIWFEALKPDSWAQRLIDWTTARRSNENKITHRNVQVIVQTTTSL